jgi:predicted Na+-dependent transporter
MLVVAALLAVVIIPTSVELVARVSTKEIRMTASGMAQLVLTTILAPLVAGFVVNLLAPTIAKRVAKAVFAIALALLLVGGVPVLFTSGL